MRTLPAAGVITAAADGAARVATRNSDGQTLERTRAHAPRVSFAGRISAHRRFAYGDLDLDTVKAIKNRVADVTVNDVVVALCRGPMPPARRPR